MDCQTFTIKRGYVYCKHFDECHTLLICLCEIEPQDHIPPPSKHKRASRLPWPERRQQLLNLVREKGAITTTIVMTRTNAQPGTVSRWLRDLTKEGEIECKAKAVTGQGLDHQPAVYQPVPHNSNGSPEHKPPGTFCQKNTANTEIGTSA